MDFMDIIKKRRSIRRFLDKEIPDEALNQVLTAVQWSPSWANTQCWEVVVVTDPSVKSALAETVSPKNPATRAVEVAPVVLALCGKLKTSGYYKGVAPTKFGDWFMFDLGIACQSLCLSAQEQGMGTVIVGLFDHDKAAAALNVPQGVEVVALIPVGYPDQSPKAPKRKTLAEFVHADRF